MVQNAKSEVVRTGMKLVEQGLVARTWGNVSCRMDDGHFAITPSGTSYDRITEEKVVVIDIATRTYEGDRKPSSEFGMHADAYVLRPDIGCVIHTHQCCATALSIAKPGTLELTPAEVEALGGFALVGYGLPGSKKLWNKVSDAINSGASAMLMERHGALLLGATPQEALERAALLETYCTRALSGLEVESGEASFLTSRDVGTLTPLNIKNQTEFDSTEEQILKVHDAIYEAYPEFSNIAHLSTPAVSAAIIEGKTMPALLDDFAQMAGSDARLITNANDVAAIVRGLKGRNCVLVKGMGALCCAGNEADSNALLLLMEKACVTYWIAQRQGGVAPLPYLERKLMRYIYQNKYAKKAYT
ncbi:class II aldolase/adducin family protein [Eubacteriales bacterium OttesenSCG-928-K08]|nr:class II aldolase/adducin family protein [Eubacteriales bacterium OttesenSCG-928-K08]